MGLLKKMKSSRPACTYLSTLDVHSSLMKATALLDHCMNTAFGIQTMRPVLHRMESLFLMLMQHMFTTLLKKETIVEMIVKMFNFIKAEIVIFSIVQKKASVSNAGQSFFNTSSGGGRTALLFYS